MLGFYEVSLLSFQTVTSLWIITRPFFWVKKQRERQSKHVCSTFAVCSSSSKDTDPVGIRPHPYDLIVLITSLKAPISKYTHGGLGIQHMNFDWGRSVCLVAQSCLTLYDPMNCNPPGSSVHGIFQTRILELFAISFSRRSSQPKDQTHVSYLSCIGSQILSPLGYLGSPRVGGRRTQFSA